MAGLSFIELSINKEMLKFYDIFAVSQWNAMISVAYNMYCKLLFRTIPNQRVPVL